MTRALDAAAAADLQRLYEEVGRVLAEHRPACAMSGRCCDFPVSDHELWSSTLEVDFARDAAGGQVPATASGRCPWYVDGLCELRDGRPLGCRLYFCDPSWADTMPLVYERFHAELQALHERHGVTYGYRRFVDAVVEGGSDGKVSS